MPDPSGDTAVTMTWVLHLNDPQGSTGLASSYNSVYINLQQQVGYPQTEHLNKCVILQIGEAMVRDDTGGCITE